MPTKELPLLITPANEEAKLASTSIPLTHRLVFGAVSGMGGVCSLTMLLLPFFSLNSCLILSNLRLSAATFCHPLDVIRVQMQTDGAYKNTFDAATKIYQRAGVVEGLYVSMKVSDGYPPSSLLTSD